MTLHLKEQTLNTASTLAEVVYMKAEVNYEISFAHQLFVRVVCIIC